MRKRKLGATGLEVSELSLGTWGLSGDGYGPVEEAEQDAVIDRAIALGVSLFETADSYADGAMERRLGFRLRIGRSQPNVVVVTKIGTDALASPARKRFDRAYLKEAAERSRERLKRESIDVLLLHNPSVETLARGETKDTMRELCEAGLARAWGASVGTAEAAAEAVTAGAQVIQFAYNALHRYEMVRIARDVKEKNIGILARSVLSYGLLCGAWPTGMAFESGDHRKERWTDAELKRRMVQLNALRPSVVLNKVPSLRAVALRYVLSDALVSSVVLGPRKAAQLDQLLRDAGKEPYLPEGAREALENRLRVVGVDA
jgi:aryl-alcohol dehydrogenase-like predicted oxidoreductase